MRRSLKSVFTGFRGESIFAAAMLSATAFGFVKTFLLAALMPVAVFGLYIAAFGGATLLAMLLSFGDTEATYKSFPQLVATGRGDEMVVRVQKVLRRLFMRVAVVFVLAFGLAQVFAPFGLGPVGIGVIVIATFAFMMQTLMASIIRAIGSERLLPPFTAARGLAAMATTVPVAVTTQNWSAVLVAEGLAQAIVFLGTAFYLRRNLAAMSGAKPATSVCQDASHGIWAARLVYLATITTALIPYGGRSAIIALDGAAMAGAFGVLNVLVQVAQMLAGALTQKLGPALLREAILEGGEARMSLLQRFGLPILFLWTASALVFIGTALSFLVPAAAAFWHSYGITIPILAVTAVQMAMSAYLYMFFAAISVDREIDLFLAALASVVVFYGGILASAVFDAGLLGHVAAAASAYAVQTIYLFLRYRGVLKYGG